MSARWMLVELPDTLFLPFNATRKGEAAVAAPTAERSLDPAPVPKAGPVDAVRSAATPRAPAFTSPWPDRRSFRRVCAPLAPAA
jgi:hypothetical protein